MNPEEKSICEICGNTTENKWFINHLEVYDSDWNCIATYEICNSCLYEKLGRLKIAEEIEGEQGQ